jgi:ribosomal protein L7/L12
MMQLKRRRVVPALTAALLLTAVWTGCGDEAAPPAAGDQEKAKAEESVVPEAAKAQPPEAAKASPEAAQAKPSETGKAVADKGDKARSPEDGKAAPTAAATASLEAGNKAILANAASFDLVVKSYDKEKKMRVIRAIRKYSKAPLKETVEALEKGATPVAQGLNKVQAEAALAELNAVGAVVELKAGSAPAVVKDVRRAPADLAAAPKGLAGCPTKGPANARVTLVEFTDFQ